MSFTYRQLKEQLAALTDEQLDNDVALYDVEGDFIMPVNGLSIAGEEAEGEMRPSDEMMEIGPNSPYLWKE